MSKVFVYGTLRAGFERHWILEGCTYHGRSVVSGELFFLGKFPGARPGSGHIIGEVYDVTDEKLQELDKIEGFLPGREDHSLFNRVKTQCRFFKDGNTLEVWIYYITQRFVNYGKKINCGDYFRYMYEQKNLSDESHIWVTCYGSNMCTSRLKERIGDWKELVKGFIPSYRLAFNKEASPESTYANMQECNKDSLCPAIAVNIAKEQLRELDSFEGVASDYMRILVTFEHYKRSGKNTNCKKNPQHENVSDIGLAFPTVCYAYIANPTKILHNRKPEEWYFSYVEAGYTEHEFSKEYLKNAANLTLD